MRADVLPQLRDEKAAQSSELPSGQFTEKSEFHALVVKVSDALKDPSLFASLLYYLEEWGEVRMTPHPAPCHCSSLFIEVVLCRLLSQVVVL